MHTFDWRTRTQTKWRAVTTGETEQQIFDSILRGKLDFNDDPWPRISDDAKDCVRKMLQQVSMILVWRVASKHTSGNACRRI